MESFFGRLKCEVEGAQMFATRDRARAAIFEYLEVFYNRARRHFALGSLSPVEYERAHNRTHRQTLSTFRGELQRRSSPARGHFFGRNRRGAKSWKAYRHVCHS